MKKYLVEFIGTFFLVLTVGHAVRSGTLFAPIAIGGILMVMIYAGGHISGGHFNPAVTLAVFLRGKCPARDVLPYWFVQFAAGVAAALLIVMIHGRPESTGMHGVLHSAIVEFCFTFALAWVVLQTATTKSTAGNSYYGLAIGGTVMAGAYSVGGLSGAAFNPAVGLGVWIMGLESPGQFLLYLIVCPIGAAVAALAFKATYSDSE